jgi:hypothetical protein
MTCHQPIRLLVAVLVAAATVIFGADSKANSGETADVLGTGVDFQVIRVDGIFNPSAPAFLVIRESKDWARFRSEAMVRGHEIDFNRFELVIVATGQKGSSGYSAVVSSVESTPSRVTEVSVLDVGPGSCPRLTEISRTKATFALIPKTTQQVRFRLLKVGSDCTSPQQSSIVNETTAPDLQSMKK